MNIKTVFILCYIGILYFSCNAQVQKYADKINGFVIKPLASVIHIKDNFYCGQTEISNINYREYVYWMGKIYGKSSLKYFSSLPDPSVWNRVDPCLFVFSEQYFIFSNYDGCPVVGISQLQAKEYCKWLSDRYFESMLIHEGIININPNQSEDSFFSIESYFSGTYNNIIPSKDIKH
ncbi:MAG: SUMF1/EgtB/PvdO family nonheme iron enzyme [Saprospiraceae bacterium]|nr:SUMF1/EgtB/PvdO family nonheme iron enzyme [Candidatus Defluviibacterium haderslevense]MBK7245456.1 SUMF1/EgtB/PvdO family nonheme iron enzyme [Candidatus Defluviibacterium haderslevense]